MDAMVRKKRTMLGSDPFHGEGRPAARTSSQYSGVAYSGPLRGAYVLEEESVGLSCGRGRPGNGADRLLTEVLEILARLEADRAAGRDLHFLARARVASDATLAGLDLEDTE